MIALSELGYDTAPKQPISRSQVNALSEQIYDEFVDYLRSLQGWSVLSGSGFAPQDTIDEGQTTRADYIRRSRIMARREPLSKQAVRLYTTYSGILKVSFKSEDETAETLWREKFWSLRANNRVLGPVHRRKLSIRLLVDGELFLALFPGNNGEVTIRSIDPLQITEVLTHPEDADTVLFYKRQLAADTSEKVQTGAILPRTVYYRDKDLTEEELGEATRAGFEMPTDGEVEQGVVVYHVPYDVMGLRGNGLLFAVLSYAEAFRGFLQDRATIVRGLSTYIRTLTVKGGSRAVDDLASRFRSALSTSGLYVETNPPDAAGSTYVQNENAQKEEGMPPTGATNAMADGRILRQPIGSGTGITEPNLTGDPSVGNLASQVQMEGPQLQNFQDYQFLWEEALKELWRYVLAANGHDETTEVDIDMPPIVKEPIQTVMSTLTAALGQNLISREEAQRRFLVAFGVNHIDKIIEAADEEREENKREQEKQMQQGQRPQPQQQQPRRQGFKEHGSPIPGPCPFCGVERLQEAHGINFCLNCEVSYNPGFHGTNVHTAKLKELLEEASGQTIDEEEWPEIVATLEVSRNGN